MVSAASVAIGTNVYIIGGYNGQDYSEMIKLSLPEDRCHLIKDVTCKNSSGCKAIVVPGSDEKNITSCFSSDRASPDEYVFIKIFLLGMLPKPFNGFTQLSLTLLDVWSLTLSEKLLKFQGDELV